MVYSVHDNWIRPWCLLHAWNEVRGFCFDSPKVCLVTFRPALISWCQRKHNRCVCVCGWVLGGCIRQSVHRRLMTADGRMFMVGCEWAEEQQDVIQRSPAGQIHAASHRGRVRTIFVGAPRIWLDRSEHWQSKSDNCCNLSYLCPSLSYPSYTRIPISHGFGWILTINIFLHLG